MQDTKSFNLWGDKIPYYAETVDFIPKVTYYPANSRGAVIVFAGGSYSHRAVHESYGIAEWLSENGVQAFVIDYRVLPYRHPSPLCDAMRAIRYVRHNAELYGIDKNKIAVIGSSAGGHLVGSLSVHYDKSIYEPTDEIDLENARPDATFLCYSVIDFSDAGNLHTVNHLLGENPSSEDIEFLSIHKHINANTPEAFIWHTATDPAVSVKNSLLYAEALVREKIPVEMHIYPIGPHGLGLAKEREPYVSSWGGLLLRWLELRNWK